MQVIMLSEVVYGSITYLSASDFYVLGQMSFAFRIWVFLLNLVYGLSNLTEPFPNPLVKEILW